MRQAFAREIVIISIRWLLGAIGIFALPSSTPLGVSSSVSLLHPKSSTCACCGDSHGETFPVWTCLFLSTELEAEDINRSLSISMSSNQQPMIHKAFDELNWAHNDMLNVPHNNKALLYGHANTLLPHISRAKTAQYYDLLYDKTCFYALYEKVL